MIKVELSEQDLKFIRNSLGLLYNELCEKSKIVKSKIEDNPKSILNICNNFVGQAKEIDNKIDEILNLENRIHQKLAPTLG